jgi:hypothetical protein
MAVRRLIVMSAVGCRDPESQEQPTPTALDLLCTPHPDNALRATCTVTVSPPGPVALQLEALGEEPLRFGAEGGVVEVWGLLPDTVYQGVAWAEASPEVQVRTVLTTAPLGRVPEGRVLLESPEHATRFVLFDLECDSWGLWVLDDRGRLRWSETFPELGEPGVLGYEWTEDGTVLALAGQEHIVELELSGRRVWTASRAEGAFAGPVHHDVTRRQGHTYALTALEQDGLVWDGFLVFGPDGTQLASWDARGAFDPAWGNPGCCGLYWKDWWPDALDFAHSNALGVDEQLNAYIGYRYVDTIQQVMADPADPAFGTVRWTLVGDPDSPVPSDFALTSSHGATSELSFGSQHHVQPVPGGLRLFDNRWDGTLDSRVLELDLDPASGVADIVRAVGVGARCPIMGSVFRLDNGHWLVDCGPERTFTELDPDTGTIVWQMEVGCPGGTKRPPYRAVPLPLMPTP